MLFLLFGLENHCRSHLIAPFSNSDSDDSSVEFYARKSPIDLNQSVTSNVSERIRMNHLKSSLSRSRSNISRGGRRRRIKGGSVSFEIEKAGYQALLDKMHHHTSPNRSFDADQADQNSCAPSLANTLDLDLLSSSSPTNSTKSTPMANFLSKIGFSRSASTDIRQRPKDFDEDNQLFVANFFYTNETSNIVDSNGVPSLKLDINPNHNRNPFCLSGCGSDNLLPNSACETATKYADFVFGWFSVRGDQQKKGNAIIDLEATEHAPQPKWMNTWQTKSGRRFYTPPKLSAKHLISHEDDIFCTSESAKMGSDCENTLSCPVARERITCPEILNKTGCSPE